MKLGYIDYLNCYPFYYHMLEKIAIANVKLIPGYPNELNEMMNLKHLDMSPISSAAYPDLQDEILLIPDFCLSSIGYVRSVLLLSKVAIEELDNKRVGLSSASKTSAVLIKILLKKYYNINPIYQKAEPNSILNNFDAVLIIGNEALMNIKDPVPYIYDLGDLWLRKTGFPVIFAVFAIQKRVLNKHRMEIKTILQSFRVSLQCLQDDREQLIKYAQKRYPQINYDIDKYYSLLKFDFSDELKRALEYYLFEAGELELMKKIESLRFVTFD